MTLVRDTFIAEMEDVVQEFTHLGFDNATEWMKVYVFKKTEKRRVEYDEFIHPSVSVVTDEGAAFARLTVRKGYASYVVPDTLTGEVKISGEFIDDMRYDEVSQDSYGLGTAMARKRYKDAMSFLYNAFGSVFSPDGMPVFSSNHVLINPQFAGQVGNNLLTNALSTDSFDAAVTLLLQMVNENGDVLPTTLGRIQLIVPPTLRQQAYQIKGSEKVPENMQNGVNIYSDKFGEYNIEVVVLPLLAEAPAAYAATQWYVRLPEVAKNTFWERKAPNSWMIKDQNSLCVLHQCEDRYGIQHHNWRGIVGSKGLT